VPANEVVHCQALYTTTNLMLIHMPHVPPSRVIESKNKDFAVGDLVVAGFGWRTHTITDGKQKDQPVHKIDPSIPLRASTALGILGMPG